MKREDEVEVTQYIRPNGRTEQVYAPVGVEYVKMAEEKDLIISSEVLTTGEVAIYVRRVGQAEEEEKIELADNGPGEDNPVEVLKRMIRGA